MIPFLAASPQSSSSSTRVPWWEWPQTLSLEAPLIAVAWMAALATAHRVSLPPSIFWALALAVLAIYLLDRLIDAHSGAPDTLSNRHRFCRQHQFVLLLVILPVISLIGLWLALFHLPAGLVWSVLTITPLLIIYLVIYVAKLRLSTALPRFVRKEIAGGVLFAIGTTCGLRYFEFRVPLLVILLETVLLSCLFSANLLLNTIAEQPPHQGPRRSVSLLFHFCIALPFITAAAIVTEPNFLPAPIARLNITICFAALAIVILHRYRSHLSAPALRSIGDLILLLSAVALWFSMS